MNSRERRQLHWATCRVVVARVIVAVLCVSTVATGILDAASAGPASASSPAPIAFVQEPFTGPATEVPPGWEVPGVPSGGNVACLTAATSTATTIPTCGGTPDAAGSGALRLTAATASEEGGVAGTVGLPSSQGLDITFDTYQYGGTPSADGMMFFLAAANPAAPQPPTSLGEPGGYLAYSGSSGGGPGLVDGYLGVGLDAYGNYTQ